MLTTQEQVRRQFWLNHPDLPRRFINGRTKPQIAPQNYQRTDTRCAFVNYIDHLQRSGIITEALAQRVTL